MKAKAFFISLQTTLLRQFCGSNYMTMYAKFVFLNLKFRHYKLGPFMINIVQFIASFLGLYLCQRYRRKPLMVIGIVGAFVGTLIVAICDYYYLFMGVLIGEIIFSFFIGSLVAPIAWPYPLEVIAPPQFRFSSLVNWISSFMLAIVPIE